jgi:hypothetical protein
MTGTRTEERKPSADQAGGMASGSAGGPSQADKAADANESDGGGDGGGAGPGSPASVDLGKGSHEQTQGLTGADKS